MSLSTALSTAVTAINSQSDAFSNISNNLANTSTIGYKSAATSFQSMVSGLSGESAFDSGGVNAALVDNNAAQGSPTTTGVATDLDISGSGFFVVSNTTNGAGTLEYTRDGEFRADSAGNLKVGGEYLMGWPTDTSGNVTSTENAAGMTAINIKNIKSSVTPTTTLSFSGNLPANATTGESFTTTQSIYDSLGSSTTLTMTATYTAANTWQLSYTDSDSSAVVSGSPVTVTFNSDGTLASPTSSALQITHPSDGATTSNITMNFGTANTTNGLYQYENSSTPTMDVSIAQNGLPMGSLTGVSIGTDGSVVAAFSNGETETIYKIPIATFNNVDGLTNVQGTFYQVSLYSGDARYDLAGKNGVGTTVSGELEQSTTNISSEFSNMMSAQQAYSAAAEIMKNDTTMFQTLISSVNGG